VNIEWYEQKGKTNSLDYVIENLDPSISSNRDLMVTGFDNDMKTTIRKLGMWRLSASVRNVAKEKVK